MSKIDNSKHLKHNIKISVPQDVIDNSLREDSRLCMIANSIQGRLPWARHISVDVQSIRFNDRKTRKRYIYLTPPEAQKALVLFDQGIKVKPFSFHLRESELRIQLMRAKFKKAKKHSRLYKRNPAKKTPPYHREFGVRGLSLT